jgi:lipopolysaccharide/colanic/teichoic acid biosynthesis glycosyltransferase
MKIFYRPAYIYWIIDFLILTLSFYLVLDWFPLTTDTPFTKYSWPWVFYIITWLTFSYFLKRYIPLKKQGFFQTSFKLFYTTLFIFSFFYLLIFLYFGDFSINVLFSITLIAFAINYLALNIYFAYRYAVDYNDIVLEINEERDNAYVKPPILLDDESIEDLHNSIIHHSGNRVLNFLQKNIQLENGNTFVFASTDSMILKYEPQYQFSTIVQLEKLNNIRGINKMLTIANEKLPDDGLFVCCFESKSTYKKLLLKRYPKVLNSIIYSFDFFLKRITPKMIITRNIYYSITGGMNRILSKAEVLGRLYCCGFSVVQEKKIGQLTYLIAVRVKQPESRTKLTYGPLIRLHRFGKNGIPFEVYKMRTMHPYSEYLQAYIYEHNNLREGGKFNKDFRITTIGRLMRKYWLDELPMILNMLKGEMKLVGVRPLSAQYFSLYSKELQQKRIKFKPGLLPPFYADMPRTLTEIEASEMNYLTKCEKNGVFITDIQYFIVIMKNILFNNARSA